MDQCNASDHFMLLQSFIDASMLQSEHYLSAICRIDVPENKNNLKMFNFRNKHFSS